jgi:hypothetical protein
MLKQVIHRWERKLSQRDNNRVVRPFEWGVEELETAPFTQSANPSKDQKQTIFGFNEWAVSESEKYFTAPAVPDFQYENGLLTFRSTVTTPFPENNTVYARYFPVPAESESRNAADEVARSESRAVIVLPHWNAKSREHVALCQLLNRTGIAALRLSMPYHDQRMLPGFERADYMVSANLGRTLQANRQAVLDTRSAIQWLKARGYERIGIVGTSLGSCIAFLTLIHEPLLKVGVYYHVSSYFGDVVWEGLTTVHVRKGLEPHLNREEVRKAFLSISPNSYVKKLIGDKRPCLLISARYDLSFTPELSRLLFEECDRHGVKLERALMHCGHYSLGRAPYKYYAGFLLANYFRKHL